MSKINFSRISIIILITLTSCYFSKAPDNYLPKIDKLSTNTFGGWLIVDYADDSLNIVQISQSDRNNRANFINRIDGEFLSYEKDSVYILIFGDYIKAIHRDNINKVILELDKKNLWTYFIWGTLGTLSTISHGYYSIITAPLWIITSTGSAIFESKRDLIKSNNPDIFFWVENKKFSRFPQGLPRGIDLKKITNDLIK